MSTTNPNSGLCKASRLYARSVYLSVATSFCVCLLGSISQAWLVSEQKQVDVGSLWNDDDVMVLVAARSMG